MSTLERKLTRDLWRLKGQVATIALVLACGILAMIMLRSTYQSLLGARDQYYERYRFADVFAHAKRAPDTVAARLERLPGVALVYPRLVENVMVPMPDEPDPVTGRIISIPDDGEPPLNALYLRSGRMPVADDEAVILEQFAEAHRMTEGATLPVVINGRLRTIRVVGIALSPEYVLAMAGFEMIPDARRFVVLWMRRGAVAPAFRMEGAFDDVSILLQPGAQATSVLDDVDRELARYGGLHAIDRTKQLSNAALLSELQTLRAMAMIIPAIFLAVAAFLVNVIISRLVFLERTQIAVLKALGFSDRRIAMQYLALVGLIVAAGSALGIASGMVLGRWMTDLYEEFYRFPTRLFQVETGVIILTILVAFAAAATGALGSMRRVARLPPAQAMRPPAPLVYRRSLLDRLGLGRVLGTSAMMAVREIRRRPVRFTLSTCGIAMGVGIFIMGQFSYDSFDRLMDEQFPREQQADMMVTLANPQPERALRELEHVPGVALAEGHRIVPVRLREGPRYRDTTITGLPAHGTMRKLLDGGRTELVLPAQGMIITDKLAELLGIKVGDEVDVEILEGDFATRRLPVAGLIDEAFGLQAYARADWLDGVLREAPRVSMAMLRVDPAQLETVRSHLKQMPQVLGVTTTTSIVKRYREQTGNMMLGITLLLAVSAAAISIGIVYNNARIAVSLRSRDLASLRVLGFTRREISTILLGELGAQVLLGIPLGFWFGKLWAGLIAATFDPETIRFQVFVAPKTYALAGLIALVSGVLSALLVRHKLDHLDLIGVLKSSE